MLLRKNTKAKKKNRGQRLQQKKRLEAEASETCGR